MFLESITLHPVNLLQIAFFVLMGFGALLIWRFNHYRSLAIFFIFQAILMILNFLEETKVLSQFYLITPILTLAVGPLVYFFIRSIVSEASLTLIQKYRHFIPMLIALPFTEFTQQVIVVGILSQVSYIAASFQLLNRYHLVSMSVRSDADSLKLNWIVSALIAFSGLIILDLIRLNLQTHQSVETKAAWYFIDVLLFLIVYCYLLFKATGNPVLFKGLTVYADLAQNLNSNNEPTDKTSARELCDNIEEIILQQDLFKQQRLSITDIANKTGLNIKDISWAINLGRDKNFCEYINALRVKYVQQRILTDTSNQILLLDLAFESGFNSKSTFNAVFKRVVGKTPSQFMRDNHKL